jgi:protoporphyrinogen oxidase
MHQDECDLSETFDAIVLGAGITGLVSASVLARQGSRRILVIDEYDHVGGNHIDRSYGDYTFDVGSFIFQDDSPLLAHFPDLLPLYVPIDPTFCKLSPQGRVTRYPFSISDDLVRAGPLELAAILGSAAYARMFHRGQTDARSFARYWIGDRLLRRAGLENYMERFFGLPAGQIDITFARKRMMWIAENAKLINLLGRMIKRPLPPTNRQLARPREGFRGLYAPARRQLEALGVSFMLGAKIRGIAKNQDGGLAVAANDRTIVAPRLISTIPIPRVQELCGFAQVEPLDTVTLNTLFYSFSGERGFTQSVLYNFSYEGMWKRLTMYSEFYGDVGGREYFGVEITGGSAGSTAEEADRDFRQHTAANGLLRGELKLEGSHTLASSYPVYSKGAGQRAQRALAELRTFGIESFGRQGGFDYQPTARVSTIMAEDSLRAV